MTTGQDTRVTNGTRRLNSAMIWDLPQMGGDIKYRPVPHADRADGHGKRPVWRLRFSPTYELDKSLGLDLNGEVVLGRGDVGPDFVSLSLFNADELGISRRHLLLRPTDTRLFVMDLGSTNGTWCNGRSIGVNTPHSLSDGDLLRVGNLELVVRIVRRPQGHTSMLHARADLAEALPSIALALASQLNLVDVLVQSLDLARGFCNADDVAIWLNDEQTGQVHLEAEWRAGADLPEFPTTPSEDTLVRSVLRAGKPAFMESARAEKRLLGYRGQPAGSLCYNPLTLAGVSFGVLGALRGPDRHSFDLRDQKLLAAIAELTAVAVQNARAYQSTSFIAARRAQVLAALNDALTGELKAQVNSIIGYSDLLASDDDLPEDARDFASRSLTTANQMAAQLQNLAELSAAADATLKCNTACDMIELMARVTAEARSVAATRSVHVDFDSGGLPYPILADAGPLYRSLATLSRSLIESMRSGGKLHLSLRFDEREVTVRLRAEKQSGPIEMAANAFPKASVAASELGLALVWATIEAHRGTVLSQQLEGKGSEFIVSLPASLRCALPE